MIALIDGDIFRYRCAFAAERTKYLVELRNVSGFKEYTEFDSKKEADSYAARVVEGTGATTVVWSRKDLQPLENCLQIVKSCLENTLNEVKAVEYRIWLSGKTNFRDAIAKTKAYKANRLDTPKPVHYQDVADYLVATWGAVFTEGIEADDAIGIAAMEAKANGNRYVVVSNDKDLRQIPGEHYNWITKEFSTVSAKEAKEQLFTQILAGDATDNVPGLEGIGPATAAKILEGAQSPEEMVDRVVKTYREHKHPKDSFAERFCTQYLKEQWELVYILRHNNENVWDTREGKYFLEKYA